MLLHTRAFFVTELPSRRRMLSVRQEMRAPLLDQEEESQNNLRPVMSDFVGGSPAGPREAFGPARSGFEAVIRRICFPAKIHIGDASVVEH